MKKLVAAEQIISCSIMALMCISTINATDGHKTPSQVQKWVENLNHTKQKLTKLHFYFHRLTNSGAVVVAQANITASSGTNFGLVVIKDDPLTIGPEISSKAIGFAQGFSAGASLKDVLLFESFNFVFTNEALNGSTVAVMGSNGILHKYRETAVIGGSGVFRLARGAVTYQTYFYNASSGEAVVEVEVVVLHY